MCQTNAINPGFNNKQGQLTTEKNSPRKKINIGTESISGKQHGLYANRKTQVTSHIHSLKRFLRMWTNQDLHRGKSMILMKIQVTIWHSILGDMLWVSPLVYTRIMWGINHGKIIR